MTELTTTELNRVAESDLDTANVADIRKELTRMLGAANPDRSNPHQVFTEAVEMVNAMAQQGRLESDDAEELLRLFAVLYASATVHRFSVRFLKQPDPSPPLPFSIDWLLRAPK